MKILQFVTALYCIQNPHRSAHKSSRLTGKTTVHIGKNREYRHTIVGFSSGPQWETEVTFLQNRLQRLTDRFVCAVQEAAFCEKQSLNIAGNFGEKQTRQAMYV